VSTRLGRGLLHALRPLRDRAADERGTCSVCGEPTRFVFNSWILPPGMRAELDERLERRFAARESLWCRRCGSSLRVRRVADVLLLHYGAGARSLAALVAEPGFRGLAIAEVNAVGELHEVLAGHPRLAYSEYPGEDLARLSYGDASFDLVLTSDTLEHVPDYRRALRETRRVLRPGGRHVFTVPVVPSRAETVDRGEAGLPPQYHGRASGGLAPLSRRRPDFLTYTDFGIDLLAALEDAGFEPEVHFYDAARPDEDVGLVFCGLVPSSSR
jgi:SAM-dependent methyltransferase